MRSLHRVATVVLLVLLAVVGTYATEEQGPYEDIQHLLARAALSAHSLSSLDTPGPPRVIEVHHDHHHNVPHDMPAEVAERIAIANTPANPPVRIIPVKNLVQARRNAIEDAAYRQTDVPTVSSVNIQHSVSISGPGPSLSYTVKGQRGDTLEDKPNEVRGTGYHFPLVDRGLKRPTFPVIADTDGAHKAAPWKPHTAKELQAEALKLLQRAKDLQKKKNSKAAAAKLKAQQAAMGVFDSKDAGYEDELTRLKRVSARMNRLLEQILTPHDTDTFEGSIARKRYFLKIYKTLKKDAVKIIEAYAMRTGNSIFAAGGGKIDESIAAFLPPNSVAAILAQYANPTRDRKDETPRDVISGRDAKRIKYSIDYYRAKEKGAKLPLPPVYALSDEEEAALRKHNNPLLNKVIATQDGGFGQGRPAITTGNQAIGRSSVHIAVVNPSENQAARGLPFQVNLKQKRS